MLNLVDAHTDLIYAGGEPRAIKRVELHPAASVAARRQHRQQLQIILIIEREIEDVPRPGGSQKPVFSGCVDKTDLSELVRRVGARFDLLEIECPFEFDWVIWR